MRAEPRTSSGSGRVLALRTLAEALPDGAAVPVPKAWLLELLEARSDVASVGTEKTLPADLTVAQVAARFGRNPSTVRGWIGQGRLSGAYRFQGRELRVPVAALEVFEATQRQQLPTSSAAPRQSRRRPADLGAWRTVAS